MISVVIPVYNSEKTLEELYRRLSAVLPERGGRNYEIIMVDDGSRDGSFQLVQAIHEGDPRVKAIRLDHNYGQQNAILCGFNYARGEWVITMDDDLQHPPEEIGKLLDKLAEGCDVVFGIPPAKKHSVMRNLGTLLTDWLFNRLGLKTGDIRISSFRALRREIMLKAIGDNTPFVYVSALLLRYARNPGNTAVRHEPRRYGSSNYSLFALGRLLVNLAFYYSPLALKVAKHAGPRFAIREERL